MVLGLTNEGGKYRHVSGASWHCFGGDCNGQPTRREICRLVVRSIKITAWVDLLRAFISICVNISIYFCIRTHFFFFYFIHSFFKISHIRLSILYYILLKYYIFINFFFFSKSYLSFFSNKDYHISLFLSLSLSEVTIFILSKSLSLLHT